MFEIINAVFALADYGKHTEEQEGQHTAFIDLEKAYGSATPGSLYVYKRERSAGEVGKDNPRHV